MLTVQDLSFSYGGVHVFQGVELTAPPGQVTCIIGPNGAGKTTLLKSVMGLLSPSAGSIIVGGGDLTRLPTSRRARAGLTLVPQGRQIFPRLTVEQNLLVGLEAIRGSRRQTGLHGVYGQFPKLKPIAHRLAGRLSGGEQQQLAIARALVGAPKVLLLDEPTEGIERKTVDEIGVLLCQLAERSGLVVLLVEQNLRFVKEFGDAFHWMERGVVGPRREIDYLDDEFLNTHRG